MNYLSPPLNWIGGVREACEVHLHSFEALLNGAILFLWRSFLVSPAHIFSVGLKVRLWVAGGSFGFLAGWFAAPQNTPLRIES